MYWGKFATESNKESVNQALYKECSDMLMNLLNTLPDEILQSDFDYAIENNYITNEQCSLLVKALLTYKPLKEYVNSLTEQEQQIILENCMTYLKIKGVIKG